MRRMTLALATLVMFTTLVTSSTSAVEGAPDWGYRLAHQLMSPFCPGRTLAECPSPQASELKFWILNQAAAGATEAEVREMLEQRFGDVLLAAPRKEGWGLSAYAVPILALVVGLPVALYAIRRLTLGNKAAPESEPASATPGRVDPELEKQLERELADY